MLWYFRVASLSNLIKRQSTKRVLHTTLVILIFMTTATFGDEMPTGPKVKSGLISISGTGTNHLKINQNSSKSIINWNSFSIHKKGQVDFKMPSASASSLNRVTGSTPSNISAK